MEPVHGTDKGSKSASEEDVISRMPDNVITDILNRLPIQNAVGTSILSRKWRFKWTMLTQLIFDFNFHCYLSKGRDYDLRDIVTRLLLHLIGPITKFLLFLHTTEEFDVEHINHWVMCLSRKGITEFTLINCLETPLKLSSHLFSCLELKHLLLPVTSSAVFKLDSYLPKLQELSLNFDKCTFLGEAGARKWVCEAFPCLKTLTLSPIDFGSESMLSFALEMILGSQNLQTLKIEATYNRNVPPPALRFPEVDNNLKMIKLQLRRVEFESFKDSENEVYLIKFLLACSPLLKCITIHVTLSQLCRGDNGRLPFATKLLELDRASPTAKVKIC